ncbi:MAG TPA: glycoside hydrolase family 97 protein [Solirubrobacteraceae bacterium]|nr:glycoside hydrolase family 97 protein [Solirubrobacteraceae bacterium]
MRRTLRRALASALVAVPFALLAPFAGAASPHHDRHTVTSPDRTIVLAFELDESGRPLYRVSHDGEPLLADSGLGLQFQDAAALDDDFEVRSVRRDGDDDVWRPVWGEYRTIRNRYRELMVDLREQVAPRRSLRLVFRVFDDGVAFRYVLPRQHAIDEFAITSEDTEFRFADDFTAWWMPAQFGPGSGDEHLWRRTPLSAMEAAATPVTVDAGDAGYATVHEADLIDYATMNVAPAGAGTPALRSALVALPDGVKVRGTAPHDSPWRTLVIGDTPGDLIESTMILNLNDPCAICRRDTSWIEPGKYVGVWWEIHKGQSEWATGTALPHGATTENVKRYIDFAARHGADHVLAEGWNDGWATRYTMQDFLTPTPDLDLEEVAAYARRRGVRWMAHNETGGNVSNYMSQIEPAFSLYRRLGVRAVKTGYAGDTTIDGVSHNHYDQAMVNHYRDTIRIAARHHLMVEAHEMVKDTGERRTYPNIMTREAVRGIEWEAWSEGSPPEHLVNIPFTRMISGPVSYTPGIFNTTWDPGGPGRPPWRTLEHTRVHSTRAAQMAIYPVYLSGLQMMADIPEHYEGEPELEFLERVPTTWDDTKVLNGRIGDHVTVARRSGHDWFAGSLTDEQDRTLSVPLRFLDSRRLHVANVYGDAPTTDLETNPNEVEITRMIVSSRDRLIAPMTGGGGQAVHLTPATGSQVRTLPRCGASTPLCERAG